MKIPAPISLIYEPSPTASISCLHDQYSQTKLDITLPTSAVSPSIASLHPLESTRDAGIIDSQCKPSKPPKSTNKPNKPKPSSNYTKPSKSQTKPPHPKTTSKLATESSLHRDSLHSSFTNDFRITDKFDNSTNTPNKSNPYRHLPTHPLENEVVEKHYAVLTLSILKSLFNKQCDCNQPNLLFFKVKQRPTVARCSSCHKQVSITANTPLHKFQLPLGYFSYILHDAILQYPKVITSTEISRKLNLPYKTAYFLKRRLQVVTSMLNTKLRENLKSELSKYADDNPLTLPKGEDLKPLLENYPVASADAVVLYSSSVKANKYRSRRFRTGTSSIYKSNNLGGEQVGTLVHTIGVKGSYTFYKSIPLTKQEYLLDDLESVIPRSIPLFTDEGYKFIWDRKNHRMVNHSKRSNDPRYNMSRERWVTKEGVSSNIAEGRNNILKQAFRSYYYVSPKWSQVYLDELSFLGNLRYNKDLARLFFTGSYTEGEKITCSGYTVNKQLSLKRTASEVKTSVNSSYVSDNKLNVKNTFALGKLGSLSSEIVGSGNKICSKGFYPLLTQTCFST